MARGFGRIRQLLSRMGLCLGAFLCAAGQGHALECKPKTAGYFRDLENAAPRTPLPVSPNGVIRSLTGTLGDPRKGRTVMISADKGNCLACHRVAALSSEPNHGDLGPTLNGVGLRYSEAQLRQLMIDPKTFWQNTIMPAFHVTDGLDRVPPALAGRPILSAAEIEDVVAFLKTLR
jgi:sulfur-oxidizing protein SoxX